MAVFFFIKIVEDKENTRIINAAYGLGKISE
jgi:hypothetical protein